MPICFCDLMRLFPHNIKSGFTLTEMAVVLVIIATLTGMSISATIPTLQQARVNATAAKIAVIEKALLSYSSVYGRIPCPGDLTITQGAANYGLEAGTKTGGTGSGDCINNGSALVPAANFKSAGGIEEGSVPVAALGLPNDFMYDGWGNKFRYAVDPSYTLTAQFSGWPLMNNMCSTSSSSITVNDENGGARTTKGIYAIVSHGPNGHGAYTSTGATVNAGIQATDEQTNCHCDATGANSGGASVLSSSTYVQKDPQYQTGNAGQTLYYFDDIVTYKENWQMQTASNPAPSKCTYFWVADYNTCNVYKIDSGGHIQTTLGTGVCGYGTSPVQFGRAMGVALDSSNNLYVADWGNALIRKLSSGGTWISDIGGGGTSAQRFSNLLDVKVDNSGNIWALDAWNNRVMKFDSTGTWQMTLGGLPTDNPNCSGTRASATTCNNLPAGSGGNPAAYQHCCAPNASNCDGCSNGIAKGQFFFGNGGQFRGALAFDPAGHVWVSDSGNGRAQEFDSTTGQYLGQITGIDANFGFTFDTNGNLWTFGQLAWNNLNAVQKLTSPTWTLTEWDNTYSPGEGGWIVFDSSGYFWTGEISSGTCALHKYNTSGVNISTVAVPAALCNAGAYDNLTGIAISTNR